MRIGPYEVLSELGRGGMGAVYRASTADGNIVAVKVLLALETGRLARFERERRLLAIFTAQDGFVPLLDAGVCEVGPYVVMPLLEGGTLRARLLKGALGIEETAELAHLLARAVGRAHGRGVVHRDLKPENILFTREGRPLVADLGLAKHFDRQSPGASQSASLSASGAFFGTAGYTSPEQLEGAREAGPPADVFSLGAILYECLAGRPAFVGPDVLEVLASVAKGSFEPVRKLRPDTPPWLAAAIEKALASRVEDRFADALALERALRAPSGKGRGPRSIGWVAGAIVLLVAGAVALDGRSRPAPPVVKSAPPAPPARPAALPPRPPSAADIEPGAAQALYERANVRATEGDLDGALADYDRSIALGLTSSSELYYNRGVVRVRAGDLEGAMADYDKAIAIDPSNALAFYNRGLGKQTRGDRDGALADYDRAVEADPRFSRAFVNRAAVREENGDLDGAIADLGRAIEADPNNSMAYTNRGIMRKRKGDLDGAIADYGRAIEVAPHDAEAFGDRGNARREKGDTAGAIADFEQFLRIAPDDPQAPGVRSALERLKARAAQH